jgi:hypothetical protein
MCYMLLYAPTNCFYGFRNHKPQRVIRGLAGKGSVEYGQNKTCLRDIDDINKTCLRVDLRAKARAPPTKRRRW